MPITSNLPTKVSFDDTASLDAFSRQRVSDPITIFDSQSQYGHSDIFWESLVNDGAVTNSLNESAVILSTDGTTDGNFAYRQTRTHFLYQPGKSQLIFTTFCMSEPITNARTRIGYFDGYNGIFLQRSESTVSIVKRTNTSGTPTDIPIPQTQWNIDKMNGTGPSKITLDLTKTQILIIDLQWLGVGRVRVGFDIDGLIYYVHQFVHANILNTPYMTTANLPIRTEVENFGTASGTLTLKHICSAVISEGGFEEQRGLQFAANTGAAVKNVTTRAPVLSVRAKTTGPNAVRNTGQILLKSIEVAAATNGCLYEIVLNGTLTGASFSAFNETYSLAEIDLAATEIADGLVIDSGFIPAGGGGAFQFKGSGKADLFRKIPLVFTDLNDHQDVVSIVLTSQTGTSATNSSITWQEFY